jgi:uroporphyrinogen decarboxylase
MNPRERVQTALEGGVPDRVPYQDAFWQSTIARWRQEGLPTDMPVEDYFCCEIARLGGDYTLQLPVEEIESTERYRVYVDSNGATRKEIGEGDDWTPNWLDFKIKGRGDWDKLKERAGYDPSRIPVGVGEAYHRARQQERFVAFSAHACFHPTWQKVGMETLLVWMLEDPELVDEMFATHAQLIVDLYEGIKARGVEFDGAWLSDDLGYRNAPLISPALYCELVLPHHQKLCDHFARDGLRTILHSDGNVGPLIPHFLEAGFAALHPLEVKVGLDVRDLRLRYGGRLALFGNIDVRRLAGTREEIEEEVRSKVGMGKIGGGYLFHSDHSVPCDVSLANYRFALEMLDKYGWCD